MRSKSKFQRRLEYKSESQLDAIEYALAGRNDALSLQMRRELKIERGTYFDRGYLPTWSDARQAWKDVNRDRRSMTLAENVLHFAAWAEARIWAEKSGFYRSDYMDMCAI